MLATQREQGLPFYPRTKMCLSFPYKILKINKNQAEAETLGDKKKIGLGLVEKIKTGDYVLVQNNQAVKKIASKEAQEILELIAN